MLQVVNAVCSSCSVLLMFVECLYGVMCVQFVNIVWILCSFVKMPPRVLFQFPWYQTALRPSEQLRLSFVDCYRLVLEFYVSPPSPWPVVDVSVCKALAVEAVAVLLFLLHSLEVVESHLMCTLCSCTVLLRSGSVSVLLRACVLQRSRCATSSFSSLVLLARTACFWQSRCTMILLGFLLSNKELCASFVCVHSLTFTLLRGWPLGVRQQ